MHAHTEEKKIETIIANGIGTSIQDAVQNAAENALTQAVGSFIDATTLVEKRTEIADGVISRSKSISKDIKEYSQGSIQYFEVLDTKQTSGIFRITARVDVRIEDFRAYIKVLASGNQEISTSLFAEAIVEQENENDRFSLVYDKILKPIMAGEVHNISINRPISLKKFMADCPNISQEKFNSLLPRNSQNGRPCQELKGIQNTSNIFVFPFSISLRDDFVENMINIFENVSNSKRVYSGNNSINQNLYRPTKDIFLFVNNRSESYVNTATAYTLDNFDAEVSNYLGSDDGIILRMGSFIQQNEWGGACNAKVVFSVLDKNSNTLWAQETNSCNRNNLYDLKYKFTSECRERSGSWCDWFVLSEMDWEPELSLYTGAMNKYIKKAIIAKRNYYFLAYISPEVLKKASSVEINYAQDGP